MLETRTRIAAGTLAAVLCLLGTAPAAPALAEQARTSAAGTATVRIIHPSEGPTTGSRAPGHPLRVTAPERRHSTDRRHDRADRYGEHPRNVLPSRPVVSTVPRAGTEPPLKNFHGSRHRPSWSPTWRTDHRYDWRNWRRGHRERYHFHSYLDPYGWGYYRYSIGWRLWPHYYGSHYWIADPAYYLLPPAPPGTHWVRYYNDALLVDTWTGEVIDIIYDFFW